MCDHKDALSATVEFGEEVEDFYCIPAVEGTCWFVGKEKLGIVDKCSCDSASLLLAARHL